MTTYAIPYQLTDTGWEAARDAEHAIADGHLEPLHQPWEE